MNDVSKAIKVALSVRQYLKENAGCAMPNSKEVIENYKRITQQVKNLGEL
ncbi:hypothetical protein [Owenweeksia hongkongensis]